MPSASAKLEKQASLEASEPLKQVLNVVEKKVRNLEKRKGKLDVYKEESAQGKELNEDQKNAVMRYEEVVQSLEVARELQKQFVQITQEAVKSSKKQAKRDQVERQLQELQRVKDILKIQDVLSGMGDDATRADFLSGGNGALTLTKENLDQLDKLYKLITPAHEVDDAGQTYEQQLVAASEHIVSVLDGRSKEVLGTTYKGLKELIFRIHDCGYFNEAGDDVEEAANGEDEENQCADDGFGENVEEGITNALEEKEELDAKETQECNDPVQEIATSVQPELPMVPPIASPDDNSVFSTFTHNRPYTEVISGSQNSFNFLQESQIDLESPHMDPAVVAAHPMVPTSRTYQSVDAYAPAYHNHSTGEDQTIVRGGSPSAPVPPTTQPAQYVQQIPTIQPTDYSQIPTQTFTNQNYVTLQTFNPAVYGQVPAQSVPQPAIISASTGNIDSMGAEQATDIPEPKRHYMNVNATAFESVAYKQVPNDDNESALKSHPGQPGVDSIAGNQDDASRFSQQTDQDSLGGFPRDGSPSNNFQGRAGYGSGSGGGSGRSSSSSSYRGNSRAPRGTTNGYGGRGSRPNVGFSNGRGASSYQGYRNEGNNFYQNGYQRENFGSQTNYNKPRGTSTGALRGGPRPGNPRGNGNNSSMPRGTPRGTYAKPMV